MSEALPLPESDIEYRLAARLIWKKDEIDLMILENLVGHPKKYHELKGLLKDQNDNALTKTLQRLRRDGLIDQGLDFHQDQGERYYALTNLGVLVVIRIHDAK